MSHHQRHPNDHRTIDLLLKVWVVLCFLFVIAPIAASFVFSFNSDRFPTIPLGHFSLEWYRLVFADSKVWDGLRNTVIVAGVVAVVATGMGFGAAYTDYRYNFTGKQAYLALALIPPTIPAIIMGLAMLAYLSRLTLSGSVLSVIIAHVVICSPFAMAIIRLRLSQMDSALERNGVRCATSSSRSACHRSLRRSSSRWRCRRMNSPSPGSSRA